MQHAAWQIAYALHRAIACGDATGATQVRCADAATLRAVPHRAHGRAARAAAIGLDAPAFDPRKKSARTAAKSASEALASSARAPEKPRRLPPAHPAPGLGCRRHGSEIHNQRSPTHCCIRALASYGSRPNSRPGGETGRRTSLRCWRPLPGMQVQFLSWAPLPAAALDAASGDDFPSARCGDGDHRPLCSAAQFPRRAPRSRPNAAPTAAALPQRRTQHLTSW